MLRNHARMPGLHEGMDHSSFFFNQNEIHGPHDFGIGQFVLSSPLDSNYARQTTAGGSGTGGTVVSPTTTATASPFVIHVNWDASVSAAPAGFTAGVLAAVQYLQTQFTDAVTININVGYGETGGTSIGGLGSSMSYLTSVSYAQLVTALKADATSSADLSALASLAATSPVNGNFWITRAEAKALGLVAATSTSIDGYVGFSSSYPFTYDNSGGVAGGTYDFNGVVLHEISEVMGRMMLTGGAIGTTANSYYALDLMHYSAPGVRDFSGSVPGYFSVDGGVTNLADFNTVSGGDSGDWGGSMGNDAVNAFSYSGVVNPFSAADLASMDVIGWNRATSTVTSPPPPAPLPPAPVPSTTPTGVSMTPVAASLARLQTTSAMMGNVPLASLAQVGGVSGHGYSYALSGTGAAAFTLSTASNAATLAARTALTASSAAGTLHALAVTVTDTTAGLSSAAIPVNVVVGTGGNDTVQLAALSGALGTSTPAFIVTMGGNDRIDGTGMTGKLWFAGGAGADTMTGGTGVNTYMYGSAGDSMASAMDIVTNFRAGRDLIDLSGLGVPLQYAGSISNSNLGARSVGWQTSGGNTFVYVNTSAANEKLTATNMKIELLGAVSLSSNSILHV